MNFSVKRRLKSEEKQAKGKIEEEGIEEVVESEGIKDDEDELSLSLHQIVLTGVGCSLCLLACCYNE